MEEDPLKSYWERVNIVHTLRLKRAACNCIAGDALDAQSASKMTAKVVQSCFRRGVRVGLVVWNPKSFYRADLSTRPCQLYDRRSIVRRRLTLIIRAGSLYEPSTFPPCCAAARRSGKHFCVSVNTRCRLSVMTLVKLSSWCDGEHQGF